MEKHTHQNRLADILSEKGIAPAEFRRSLAAHLDCNPNALRALVSAWIKGKHRLSWKHEIIVKKLLDLPIDPLYHGLEDTTEGS